jgi:hypothetical protein
MLHFLGLKNEGVQSTLQDDARRTLIGDFIFSLVFRLFEAFGLVSVFLKNNGS